MRIKGFTLIEILVAMAIFAVIATLSYSSLSQVTRAKAVLDKEYTKFSKIQRVVSFLERDFMQIAPRVIRVNTGLFEPALVSDGNKVSFTRIGRKNLLKLPQSNMLRVAYRLDGDKLLRETWPVLDRVSATKVQSVILLEQVKSLKFFWLNAAKDWKSEWPPAADNSAIKLDNNSLPRFIKFTLELEDFGEITRVLPGVG